MRTKPIIKNLLSFVFCGIIAASILNTPKEYKSVSAETQNVTADYLITSSNGGNGFVQMIFSSTDYLSASSYTSANSAVNIASLYSYIYVNDAALTSASQPFFNFAGNGSFALHFGPGGNDFFNTMTKITLKQGLTLPSYSGTDSYVLSKDTTFNLGSGNITGDNVYWEKEINGTPVTVTGINTYPNSGNHFVSFIFSNNDYSTASTTSASSKFIANNSNFLSHVLVNDVAVTAAGQPFFNFFGSGGFGVNIGNSTFESARKITVKRGLIFPSYLSYDTQFVVESDVTFVLTSGTVNDGNKTWTDLSTIETDTNTSISSIKMIPGYDLSTRWIRIELSSSDYLSVGCDYNLNRSSSVILSRIQEYNFLTNLMINGVSINLASTEKYLNYYSVYGTIAFKLTTSQINDISTITIPAGTEFPAYSYVNIDSTQSYYSCFKTTVSKTYEKHGSSFFEEGTYSVDEQPTSVDSITIRTQDSGYAVAFHLSNSDYQGKTQLTNINDVNDLNFLSFIKINTYSGNPFTAERFINVWGYDGCFVLRTIATSSLTANFITDIESIEIDKECQFPSYAYGSGAQSTPKIYVTHKKMMFVNDGAGNFTYNSSAYDYTLPEGYMVNWTTVTSLKEQNTNDFMSFLEFGLSSSDYTGKGFTATSSYSSKLAELNYLDYIYVNNQKLSTLLSLKYSTESFINFSLNGSFAFRKPGNNTGCFYLQSGSKYETEDLTAYDVAIAKGCAFPSIAYLNGETSTPTCYVVSENVRFVYSHGQYIKTTEFDEPNRISSEVTNVSSHGSGVDTAIDITIDNYDFPNSVSDVVFAGDLINYSFSLRIGIMKNDGTLVSNISAERFANVWCNKTSYSIRKPSDLTFADICYVAIYAGCEFPTYSAYQGNDLSSYIIEDTIKFYSNGDGTFYKANGVTASEFAASFLTKTSEVCADYDGNTNNSGSLTTIFAELAETYALMAKEEKALIISSSDDQNIQNMLTRYDFLVRKYGLNNFLNRTVQSHNSLNKTSNHIVSLVAAISLLSVAAFAILVSIKARRRKYHE